MKSLCCPRCLHPVFDLVAPDADGRPRFKCQHCAEKWTCGKDGGPYLDAAKGRDVDRRRCPECWSLEINATETVCLACSNHSWKDR